ncbi:hypothetical protein FO519_010729, partial [Halicephalobus sp. NKZ332]
KTPPIIEGSEIDRGNEFIGQGIFGRVYIALYDGKRYAWKEYKKPTFEKAKHEAECLKLMNHPNIVKVFGLCQNPVSILMQLCEGENLDKLIKKKDFNPPLRILLVWTLQVAEGLWHMHNREIPVCHGDIKP